MKITVINKEDNGVLLIDAERLIGTSTRSLYIRTGWMHGTRFLSQRGNGPFGAGDICSIEKDAEITVGANLYNRIYHYAQKSSAIIE